MTAPPLDDQARVLLDVVGRLERAGLDYMISGSVALSAYARPRMTRDIDVVVAAHADDVDALIGAFGDEYYLVRDAVVRAVRERRLVNAIHHGTLVKVDLVIRKDEPFRLAEFERRRRLLVHDAQIWLVAPEDLLLSKLLWRAASGSAVQWEDARTLATLPSLDWFYLEQWAARLGLADAIAQVRE